VMTWFRGGADPLSGSYPEGHRPSHPAEERKNGEVTQEGSTANIIHVSSHDRGRVADDSFGIRALYEKQRPWQESGKRYRWPIKRSMRCTSAT
jgi:hypothetical protein